MALVTPVRLSKSTDAPEASPTQTGVRPTRRVSTLVARTPSTARLIAGHPGVGAVRADNRRTPPPARVETIVALRTSSAFAGSGATCTTIVAGEDSATPSEAT